MPPSQLVSRAEAELKTKVVRCLLHVQDDTEAAAMLKSIPDSQRGVWASSRLAALLEKAGKTKVSLIISKSHCADRV